MTDLPRPRAARLARPRWLDLRLVLGALLVLTSVVVGAKVVAQADDTYPVWALRHDVGARSVLTEDDLIVTAVQLEGSAAVYVAAGGPPPVGWVLTRPLAAGELLPRAALARPSTPDTRRVAVPVTPVVAADLSDGAVVDVYVVPTPAPGLTTGTAAPARVQRVLSDVTVAKVEQGGRSLSSSSTSASVVLILRTGDPDEVTAFLEAQARGTVQLVRVPAQAP